MSTSTGALAKLGDSSLAEFAPDNRRDVNLQQMVDSCEEVLRKFELHAPTHAHTPCKTMFLPCRQRFPNGTLLTRGV